MGSGRAQPRLGRISRRSSLALSDQAGHPVGSTLSTQCAAIATEEPHMTVVARTSWKETATGVAARLDSAGLMWSDD